jgi:hypothetical protein
MVIIYAKSPHQELLLGKRTQLLQRKLLSDGQITMEGSEHVRGVNLDRTPAEGEQARFYTH